MNNEIILYCDGGARGNPGPAASAFVAIKEGKVAYKEARFLGEATNNVAEYTALIMALSWLVKSSALLAEGAVTIVLDSELVTKQMKGLYKVKSKNLKELYLKAKKLEGEYKDKIYYRWSSRENNRLADFLVNEELDKNS